MGMGHRAIASQGEDAMAYLDTAGTGRTLGTGAIVLAIEAGLGLALVTGLATTMTRKVDPVLVTHHIPKPKDPLPPPPQVNDSARKDPSVIDRPDTRIKLPTTSTDTTFPELKLDSGNDGTEVLGEAKFPTPEPTTTPPPLFKPISAKPNGKWQQWVTTNDYPTHDLRAEHQGTSRYRLSIDSAGQVTNCAITTTSGWPGLDKAACERVSARARFEPATDQSGARVSGSYSGSVTWQIPRE
jgi:periplasmic protein TonB